MYNFENVIDRKGTLAEKLDTINRKYEDNDIIPLGVADMDFLSSSHIIDVIRERANHGIYGYTRLSDTYFKTICKWYKKRYNAEVDEKDIVFCPRIKQAIYLLVSEITNEGDGIVIQTPIYPPLRFAIEFNGRRVIENRLILKDNKYFMDFSDLEEKFKKGAKAIILCSPHNPVGRVWSLEELKRLGELCLKYDVLIISDEVHGDFIFNENVFISIANLDKEIKKQAIICSSPAKTFNVPGIHISNVIIKDDILRNRFRKALERIALEEPNYFVSPVLEAAYNHGDDYLEEVKEYIYNNRNYVEKYIKVNMPKLKVIDSEGTYLMWIDCRELKLNDEELEDFFFKKCKVGVGMGIAYGSDGSGFIRLNLASPKSVLEKALKNIEKIYKKN